MPCKYCKQCPFNVRSNQCRHVLCSGQLCNCCPLFRTWPVIKWTTRNEIAIFYKYARVDDEYVQYWVTGIRFQIYIYDQINQYIGDMIIIYLNTNPCDLGNIIRDLFRCISAHSTIFTLCSCIYSVDQPKQNVCGWAKHGVSLEF